MSEVIIEYHNSTIARRIQHLELLFQNICTESVNTGKMREFFLQMKKALELVLSPDEPELAHIRWLIMMTMRRCNDYSSILIRQPVSRSMRLRSVIA